jgi:hypothetical protein
VYLKKYLSREICTLLFVLSEFNVLLIIAIVDLDFLLTL